MKALTGNPSLLLLDEPKGFQHGFQEAGGRNSGSPITNNLVCGYQIVSSPGTFTGNTSNNFNIIVGYLDAVTQ